jgi:hypothetical protein
MNTRVEPSRVGLALLTIFGLVVAMLLVLGSLPAVAEDVDSWPGTSEANAATFWESFLNEHDGITGAECTKDETSSDSNFVADADYRLVVIKQGSGDLANKLYWDVESGDELPPAQNAPGWSHVIACTVPVTTTTEATTTTVEEETTTTVEEETTTTVEEETTTTVEDEVQGTVITTTTVADEVLDTEVEAEELPFTGVDSELLLGMAVLMLMSGLLVIGLTGRREDV